MSIIISKDEVREPLYCIVPLFNPWRFKTRYKHTMRAIKHFHDAGAVIVLVEVAFNRREFVFADSGLDGTAAECAIHGSGFKHKYIGLRANQEIWLKENLVHIGVQSLPYNWQQVCWLDGDIHFGHPSWVGQSIQKLQHYAFLQMFSQARDLGPNYEMLPEDYPHASGVSWVKAYYEGLLDAALKAGGNIKGGYYAGRVFPGLAWACTRNAWDNIGGIVDFAIWGGGDFHEAHCLIGRREGMMHTRLHQNYQTMMNEHFDKCQQHIRRNVGVLDGIVFHHFHGRKTERGYGQKHRLLANIGFDPIRHLKRDAANLWQLHDDGSEAYIQLRDTMRAIAHGRDEDSTWTGLNEGTKQGH